MNVHSLTRTVFSQVCFFRRASKVLYSSEHAKELKNTPKVQENQRSTHDMVGEPDPITNLRPLKFHVPENETEIEKRYRLKREEVQRWNDQFWARHNTRFFEEKAKYVKSMKKSKSDGNKKDQNVTADEMSSFYAQFLNDNWNRHLLYNYEWYKKNISLVLLSLQVKWSHLTDRIYSGRKKSV